jgi:hypothetical protein
MIPGLDPFHSLTYPFYYTGALMTQHHWTIRFIPVVAEVYIRTADTRGNKTNQDFIVPWPFHFQGLDLQRAAFLAQNGRLNPVHFCVGISIHSWPR